MNQFTVALETAAAAVQAAIGPDVKVTRDPAAIGPRVAADGVAVLIEPPTTSERSSYRTWLLQIPAQVVYGTPAGPRHIDRAYDVADLIDASDDLLVSGIGNKAVQLDAAMALPAVTVTLQFSTEC